MLKGGGINAEGREGVVMLKGRGSNAVWKR